MFVFHGTSKSRAESVFRTNFTLYFTFFVGESQDIPWICACADENFLGQRKKGTGAKRYNKYMMLYI